MRHTPVEVAAYRLESGAVNICRNGETVQYAVDDLLRATARAEARHFWFRGFRWFVTPLLRRALAGAPRARILDCGCGTGANLTLLTQFGSAYGFDISPVGLGIGRALGRRNLARAQVTAAPFASETFDVVTSFDVLYALGKEDERKALAEMFRLTRPGGFVLINVAALELLRGDHSVLSHEVRRYSRRSLDALVREAGFIVERLTYTNSALVVPLLAVRSFQRWRGLAPEAEAHREITIPMAPVNAVLSVALYLESLWLLWFNSACGSSLLCLARKPRR
jgi:SAM-dependent methyltransferase